MVALRDLAIGAGEQQDVVGDVSRGAPRLVAVDQPAAVDLLGEGAHAAEHVGAAARLGEADRVAQLAVGDRRQETPLLLLVAVEADCSSRRRRR